MSSAWLLPEHLADVLPSEAKRIEGLRRALTDEAQAYGYELVMPPLLEHLDSLLSGTGLTLGLQTFKLVDQLSGRTLGLRADTTPQVARIDAHLLNRQGVARLCYCGPVVHTRPAGPWASREPLQFGAELYGHAGLEADFEVLELALDGLRQAGVRDAMLDLGDARIANVLMRAAGLEPAQRAAVQAALATKDTGALQAAHDLSALRTEPRAAAAFLGLQTLLGLYGPVSVLDRGRDKRPTPKTTRQALNDPAPGLRR
ncbi:MAG: ATP phosphoribosyltransferase regulatory subunit, partial [Betaproteobacteria bacterium]